MAVNTEMGTESDRVHSAIADLSPEQADIGPMTPDELASLIERSGTNRPDDSPFGFQKAPTAAPAPLTPPPGGVDPRTVAHQPQQYAPPHQQYAPPPMQAPPPQPVPQYDPRVQQLWHENRLLAEKAARADEIDSWMTEHPEVLERIIEGAASVPQGATPEETLMNEVKRLRRENAETRRYADQRSYEAKRMGELSVEATQLLHEYDGQINVRDLAAYANAHGIPNLRDALAHAAGQVTLNNLQAQAQQRQQQQYYGYQQQQPQGYYDPQQYQQQPNYGYAPQQQQYPQYQAYAPAEPPPAPAPPQASVMRPGMAISDRPALRGPARDLDGAFGHFENFLREQGALG